MASWAQERIGAQRSPEHVVPLHPASCCFPSALSHWHVPLQGTEALCLDLADFLQTPLTDKLQGIFVLILVEASAPELTRSQVGLFDESREMNRVSPCWLSRPGPFCLAGEIVCNS